MRTLLRVPDLLEALGPLVENAVSSDEIFQLIGSNEIKPFGFIQRMPVFELEQIAEVASKIRAHYCNSQISQGEHNQ